MLEDFDEFIDTVVEVGCVVVKAYAVALFFTFTLPFWIVFGLSRFVCRRLSRAKTSRN